jgi:F-box protein 11
MADHDPEPRALVVAPDRTPAPLANLARRTLATIKAPESALAAPRQIIVSAEGSAMFRTIGEALAVAVDRDEILVRPGEYWEFLVIDVSVRIRGDGPREKIIVRPPSNERACISIEGGGPTLEGLTLDASEYEQYDSRHGTPALLEILHGSPSVERLDIRGGGGITIGGAETRGRILGCAVHDEEGIDVSDGASPRIEDNEVWGTSDGITIRDAGTNPIVQANRVHDVHGFGFQVFDGASPRIVDNEIWGNAHTGILVEGRGTDPLIRGNRVHDLVPGYQLALAESGVMDRGMVERMGDGIRVVDGASPRIEANEIWANAGAGVHIMDPFALENRQRGLADPDASPRIEENDIWGNALPGIAISDAGIDALVRANRVHDGQSTGITVTDGSAPRIEENEVWGNTRPGIAISGAETDAVVSANRVHDGQSNGITITDGATPRIEQNEVWGNTLPGIAISGAGTDPLVRANRVHNGQSSGIYAQDGASPRIEENDVWGNALPGIESNGVGTDPLVLANRLHDGAAAGILVSGGAAGKIEDNDIYKNKGAGVEVDGDSEVAIRANKLHGGRSSGIFLHHGHRGAIEGNEIWGHENGIWLVGESTAPVITGNRIHDCRHHGILLWDGAGGTIEHNEIWNTKREPVKVDADASAQVRDYLAQRGDSGAERRPR